MKMKISHPRFLIIGNREVMDIEFPACLERKTKSAWSDAHANDTHDDRVFIFPEVSAEHQF